MLNSQKNQENSKYLIAFSAGRKLTYLRFKKAIKYFESDFKAAWLATKQDWLRAGFQPKVAKDLFNLKYMINPEAEWIKIKQAGINFSTVTDQTYPDLLKHIHRPPWIIYHQGNLDCLNRPSLAIVGTRQSSIYGKKITARLTAEIIQSGITIVSGLAIGIDTIAQQTCWENNQPTVAVLGMDLITQPKKFLLKKIIGAGGAIISHFPLFTPASKYTFPDRNRIIAGLTLGTLVIEAKARSGALITAYQALDENREVMAVPGNIDQENSTGTNRLIQLGAKSIVSVQDVLESLNLGQID